MIDKYNAKIYRFIAKRHKNWKTPSTIRPLYDRRISYSGKDADITLKEFQVFYGVIPSSIDLKINDDKLQINRSGLFVIRQINNNTIKILKEIIQLIIDEQIRIKMISEKFMIVKKKLTIKKQIFEIPKIVSGKIILPKEKVSFTMIHYLFDSKEFSTDFEEDANFETEFYFIDKQIFEKPILSFSTTVIDKHKGTIFGLCGTRNELIIVPKHYVTFESFIKFYNLISEVIDDEAILSTLHEYTIT